MVCDYARARAGEAYQCAGCVDACRMSIGTIKPLWFREAEEPMRRHGERM